jgi:uncharacterized repeat protein (TIGR01451 family)
MSQLNMNQFLLNLGALKPLRYAVHTLLGAMLLYLLFAVPRAEAQIVVNQTTDVVGSWTATGNGTIQVTLTGADGGDGDSQRGGEGATMQATFNVTAGQVISYVVGQVGFDGDGNGDYAGGGGSAGVLIGNTLVMVAGGGGGGGGRDNGEIGLGANTGTSGDTGAGGGGAGGTNGAGGSSADGGGGGGGVGNPLGNGNGVGGSGAAGGGARAVDFTPPLSFAAGGADFDHGGDGGRGFTGGGGGDHHDSGGGGGGYSGGGDGPGGGGGGGSYINTAASEYVSSDSTTSGSNGGSNTDADGSIVINFTEVIAPTLSIDKDTTKRVRFSGQQASYTIVFSNSASNTANQDVIITDTLPAGFSFASASFVRTGGATGPGGASSGSLTNTGTASVPVFGGFTVPNGGSITITLVADISVSQAAGTYSNAVTASSNTADFADAVDDGSAKDEDVVVTLPPSPTLSIDKDTTTSIRIPGDQATYTIVISNSGSNTASEDVIITDTLPAGFTFASASFVRTGAATGPLGATSGALTNNGSAAIPALGGFTIPNGDSITLTLIVNIPISQSGGTYNNSATASSNTVDFADAIDDGTDTDEDVEVQAPGLSIDKETSTPGILQTGDAGSYTLLVTNTGTATATDVDITDTLPSGMVFSAEANTTLSGGTTGPAPAVNAGTSSSLSFEGYSIPVGGSVEIEFSVNIDNAGQGILQNAATATDNGSAVVVTDDGTETDEDIEVCADTGSSLGVYNEVTVTTTSVETDDTNNKAGTCSVVLTSDLTPVITLIPNVMVGITDFEVLVQVIELLDTDTSGTITVRIPKDSRLSVTAWDPSGTSLPTSGNLVNNAIWTFTEDATTMFFTASASIVGATQSNFGFSAQWSAGQTVGFYTASVVIVPGSGAEIRTNNNTDAEKASYSFQ